MGIKTNAYIICACLTAASINSNAAIIDNGTYTTDTASGLDWLDLTATKRMAYSQVLPMLDSGGSLEGWRLAFIGDITNFFDNLGGNSAYYDMPNTGGGIPYVTDNVPLYNTLVQLWGCPVSVAGNTCTASNDFFNFSYSQQPVYNGGLIYEGTFRHLISGGSSYVNTQLATESYGWSTFDNYGGYALVRETPAVVPVPGALWLFGTGLLGLIGVAKRRKKT